MATRDHIRPTRRALLAGAAASIPAVPVLARNLILPSHLAPREPLSEMWIGKLVSLGDPLRRIGTEWPDLAPMLADPLNQVIRESLYRRTDNRTWAALLHGNVTGDLPELDDPALDFYLAGAA